MTDLIADFLEELPDPDLEFVDSEDLQKALEAAVRSAVIAEREACEKKAAAILTEQAAEIDRLKTEISERDASFDLRWKADMRAIERWSKEKPAERELTWPDHADLCVWLMGELDRERQRSEAAEAQVDLLEAARSAHDCALNRLMARAEADTRRLDWSETMAAKHPEMAKHGLVPLTRAQIDAGMKEAGNA